MQPVLSSAQLRTLFAGDRVSRIAGPGVLHTAPVASATSTQIVVRWPDNTVGRYLRETGRRAGCPGEVLRQAEPPDDVTIEIEARLPLGDRVVPWARCA